MKRALTVLIAAALLAATPALADDGTRWLNVHVTETGDGTNVEIHLPLTMVLAVMRSVDVDNFHAGKVDLEISDADIDWPELFKAVREAPDGEFVTVDSPEAKVTVSKRDGNMYVHVTEAGEENAEVDVTLPVQFIDALTVDENNQFDVAALFESFEDLPDGDIVRVNADDAQVRVWIN